MNRVLICFALVLARTSIVYTLYPGHSFAEIPTRQLSDTENDITDGSPCKALTVIFARGTTETGNVGTLAGPPFFQALYNDLGASQVALQGVDYPADTDGFLEGGDPAGSATMASLVVQVRSNEYRPPQDLKHL